MYLKPVHMKRDCPNRSTVTNVISKEENGLPISDFVLGGEVNKFLLDTGSHLSLCKESMLKHADQILDQELLFLGVESKGRSSRRGMLNIPKVGWSPGWLNGYTLLSHNFKSAGSSSRKVNVFFIPDPYLSEISDYGSYDGTERR